ncbi:WYL domain-containing protein [Pseudanabaena sp. Chao 1811]|uniref:WYL domain-containing protein n=1 Tax=Pseudanabaena sp. Chao 1811 TaxID=2963092 RepID=UPI0022F398AF|nr:WYL domain-containing protein [Pseudanabaena sp. Chao 1811]
MRLLQSIFNVIWVLGYLGNGVLFIYTEWIILQKNFIQILNPYIHFQVLLILLSTPLFWIFLSMAVVGYYTVVNIEKNLLKNVKQSQVETKETPSPITDVLPQKYSNRFSFFSRELNTHTSVTPKLDTDGIAKQIELLEWAIQSSQKIRFNYEDKNGNNSNRTFIPQNFKTIRQTLCVEGYCYLRRAKRTFTIRRMRDIKIISANELNHNVKEKVNSSSLSSFSSISSVKDKDSHPKERPYINLIIDNLEALTNSEWNNIEILTKIYYELEFRSRPRSRDLSERIKKRLIQLKDQPFLLSKAGSETNSFSDDSFNYEQGLLSFYGYKVGIKGLPESERHKILDAVFALPLLSVNSEAYLREWGEPNSAERLQKLSRSIAAFVRTAKGRTNGDFRKAIQDWESDLIYLKKTYYNTNHFSFQYPIT